MSTGISKGGTPVVSRRRSGLTAFLGSGIPCSMSGGIVILGAGQAAAQLAVSLRQGGHDGPIRMVGDEPYAPYQRPPLSKAFLKERPAADSLLLRGAHYWADHKVQLDLGVAVATVDRAGKRVT